jgi:hypothetical protein
MPARRSGRQDRPLPFAIKRTECTILDA